MRLRISPPACLRPASCWPNLQRTAGGREGGRERGGKPTATVSATRRWMHKGARTTASHRGLATILVVWTSISIFNGSLKRTSSSGTICARVSTTSLFSLEPASATASMLIQIRLKSNFANIFTKCVCLRFKPLSENVIWICPFAQLHHNSPLANLVWGGTSTSWGGPLHCTYLRDQLWWQWRR